MPNPNNPNLKPTLAVDWGKTEDQGFTVELPSKNIVRMKRTMNLPVLLRSGKIPNPLARIVSKMMLTGANVPSMAESFVGSEGEKAFHQFMDLMDTCVVASVVEPKMSMPEPQKPGEADDVYQARIAEWTPPPETVAVSVVDMEDKLFIYGVSQGGPSDLESFREQQRKLVGDLSEGQVL